jgi:hypothetical protein
MIKYILLLLTFGLLVFFIKINPEIHMCLILYYFYLFSKYVCLILITHTYKYAFLVKVHIIKLYLSLKQYILNIYSNIYFYILIMYPRKKGDYFVIVIFLLLVFLLLNELLYENIVYMYPSGSSGGTGGPSSNPGSGGGGRGPNPGGGGPNFGRGWNNHTPNMWNDFLNNNIPQRLAHWTRHDYDDMNNLGLRWFTERANVISYREEHAIPSRSVNLGDLNFKCQYGRGQDYATTAENRRLKGLLCEFFNRPRMNSETVITEDMVDRLLFGRPVP